MAESIAFLTARGIPVMRHVGLTPQAVKILGGYLVHAEARPANISLRTLWSSRKPARFASFWKRSRSQWLDASRTNSLSRQSASALRPPVRVKSLSPMTYFGTYAQEVLERRFPAAEHVFDPILMSTIEECAHDGSVSRTGGDMGQERRRLQAAPDLRMALTQPRRVTRLSLFYSHPISGPAPPPRAPGFVVA